MEVTDFIALANSYNELGWAVQEQLRDLMEEDCQPEDCNINALRIILSWIEKSKKRGLEFKYEDNVIYNIKEFCKEYEEYTARRADII